MSGIVLVVRQFLFHLARVPTKTLLGDLLGHSAAMSGSWANVILHSNDQGVLAVFVVNFVFWAILLLFFPFWNKRVNTKDDLTKGSVILLKNDGKFFEYSYCQAIGFRKQSLCHSIRLQSRQVEKQFFICGLLDPLHFCC